jgi:TonB-linked SusC/RagA family outer membrane protein
MNLSVWFQNNKGTKSLIAKASMIMKLTIILLLFFTFQVTAKSHAQRITIVRNNIQLSQVFKDIEQQTGVHFFYDEDLIEKKAPVDVTIKDATIDEALAASLRGQQLTYTIVKNTVVIQKETNFITETKVHPNTIDLPPAVEIHGQVLDEKGHPLQNVSVLVAGTRIGTTTDAHGRFSLTVDQKNITLQFSSIGFQTKSVKVAAASDVHVTLEQDITGLNDVVIVGYGTQKKKDLTGAIARVNSEELQNRPVLRVDQMLQGRLSGVDVKSIDGAPGSGTSIRIRGARSINATNEPLYVIDGMIGIGDLNSINPEDIATIDVLKDASATAIYGSRGANGVILITTKHGKAGQDNISVNYNTGVEVLPKDRVPQLLNAAEFIQFIKDAREDILTPAKLLNDKQYKYINSLDPASLGEGTDWVDAVSKPGPFTNVNVSASGGTNKLQYYLSGNYADRDGIILGSGFKRYQVRLNLDKKFGRLIKIGSMINLSKSRTDNTNVSFKSWWNSINTLAPTFPVYNPDGSYYNDGIFQYTGGSHFNSPVALGKMVTDYTTNNNIIADFYVNARLAKGLEFNSSLGVLYNDRRNNTYFPTNLPNNLATGYTTGSASVGINSHDYLLTSNTLTYNNSFGKNHLNIVAGSTYQNDVTQGLNGSGDGFLNDIYQWNNLGAVDQTQKGVGSSYSSSSIVSFLGRVNYNFDNKYYLTVTGRKDGASNFAKNHKWGFFPSAAVKWRLSEEKLVKELGVFQNLGIRASYGVAGNQGISDYSSLAKLNATSNGYIFGNTPNLAYYSGSLANNDLTWETSKQLNIGLEMSVFKGRLSFDANYYHINTDNLLLNVRVPTQTGYSSRLQNLGATTSKGFEFTIGTENIKKSRFSWETHLTLSTNEQQIVDLGPLVKVATDNNGYSGVTSYYEVGVPLGALYGAYYAGTWKSQEEIDAELAKSAGKRDFVSKGGKYKVGGMKYKDLNHNGVLDENDMPYLGTPNPKLYGAIENTFRYRNFDLTIVFNGNYGNKMYNNQLFFMATGGSAGVYTNQYKIMANHWDAELNPTSDVPAPNSRDNVPSTWLLQDASFLRLSSAILGYTFSANQLSQKWFKNAYVYFSGSNLWLLTNYNGFDPEVNAGGTSSTVRSKDDGVYPNSRAFTFGLKATF